MILGLLALFRVDATIKGYMAPWPKKREDPQKMSLEVSIAFGRSGCQPVSRNKILNPKVWFRDVGFRVWGVGLGV